MYVHKQNLQPKNIPFDWKLKIYNSSLHYILMKARENRYHSYSFLPINVGYISKEIPKRNNKYVIQYYRVLIPTIDMVLNRLRNSKEQEKYFDEYE